MTTKGSVQVDYLKRQLESGTSISRTGFILEKPYMGKNPSFYLELTFKSGGTTLQEFEWSSEVAEALIRLGIKMSNLGEEIDRLGFQLFANYGFGEAKWGKGFFDSCLVEYLKNDRQHSLGEVLAKINRGPASDEPSKTNCLGFIKHAITGLQNSAVLELGYPDSPSTIDMMSKAIVRSIELRFHIELREIFFPGK